MRYRIKKIFLLFISTLAISACGGGGGGGDDTKAPAALKSQVISFSETGDINLLVGDVRTTSTSVQTSRAIEFSVQDSDILAVDSSGTLTALRVGSTELTLTAPADNEYQSASLTLAVRVDKHTTQITPTANALGLHVAGQSDTIATSNSDADLTYTSANPAIASVDTQGRITGLSQGSTEIYINAQETDRHLPAQIMVRVDVSLAPQQLTFLLGTNLFGLVDEQIINTITSPGTGDISYSSSDDSIASVDAAGQVTIHAPGQATISVAKAADRRYNQANDSFDIRAVNRTNHFVAWVGEQETELEFSPGSEGVEFVASRDDDCDFDNANGCTYGQYAVIDNAVKTDQAFTRTTPARYQFRWGNYTSQLPVNSQRWSARVMHRVVAHGGALYLIGGESMDDNPTVDVWQSVDGIEWSLLTADPGMPGRYGHAVASFAGKLWLISGGSGSYYADIWSSADGITWQREVELAPFGKRQYHQLQVHEGALYLIGGRDRDNNTYPNDCWRSTDGIHWELLADNVPLGYSHPLITSHGGKLWLISSADGTTSAAYQSEDGIHWTATGSLPFFTSGDSDQLISHGDALWLVAEEASAPLSSTDGSNWTEQTPPQTWPIVAGQLSSLNGTLLLVGGGNTDRYSPDDAVYQWDNGGWLNISNQFPGNKKPAVLTVKDNQIAFISQTSDARRNQLFSSTDGAHWQQSTAKPGRRLDGARPTPLLLDDRLWLLDGHYYSFYNSQYSDDLTHWQPVATQPGWTARWNPFQFSHQNRLWLAGGTISSPYARLSDVWSSVDGETWQQHADNPLFLREIPALHSFNGKLFLIGGLYNGVYHSDIWSSEDGDTWTQEVQSAPFGHRVNATLFHFQGKLWLVGGEDRQSRTWYTDIWSSADGINWQQEADNLPFGPLSQPTLVEKDGWLYLMPYRNDRGYNYGLWRSRDGVHWQQRYEHQAHFPLR